MNDYISKPIIIDQFFQTLTRWIPESRRGSVHFGAAEPSAQSALVESLQEALPGVNVALALRRVSNDPEIYLRIMKTFREDQREIAAQILSAMETRDKQTVVRLAHLVKGVAANVGAEGIAETARQIEGSLQSDADTAKLLPLVQQFTRDLDSLLASIDALLTSRETSAPDHGEASRRTPPTLEQMAPLFNELQAHISFDDTSALDDITALRKLLIDVSALERLAEVEDAVNDYDFGRALQLLPALQVELDVA